MPDHEAGPSWTRPLQEKTVKNKGVVKSLLNENLDVKTNKNRIIANVNEFLKHKKSEVEIDPFQIAHSSINKGYLNNKEIQRVIFYLRGRGCEWATTETGGCYMCGHYFGTTKGNKLPQGAFYVQFLNEYKKYDFSKIPMVCIYNAGSLLNNNEIPREELYCILKEIALNKDIKCVILESRPEFIDDHVLNNIQKILNGKIVEIGIGLETSNDKIRDLSINKGFSFVDYVKASVLIRKYGIKVLTYLTIKPIFLTVQESIEDILLSMEKINSFTDIVSLEPISIQTGTMIEFLYTRGVYQIPKGWILKEIFKEITYKELSYQYEIRIGGFEFFPIPKLVISNCNKCNYELYQAIDMYNTRKDYSNILNLSCDCYQIFKEEMIIENEKIGTTKLEERISKLFAKLAVGE